MFIGGDNNSIADKEKIVNVKKSKTSQKQKEFFCGIFLGKESFCKDFAFRVGATEEDFASIFVEILI